MSLRILPEMGFVGFKLVVNTLNDTNTDPNITNALSGWKVQLILVTHKSH